MLGKSSVSGFSPEREEYMYYDIIESGRRIKELRKKNRLTQEQLAEKVAITREFLSMIESGKKGCSIDTLGEFSNVFCVSMDYIVYGKKENTELLSTFELRLTKLDEEKRQLAIKMIDSIIGNLE